MSKYLRNIFLIGFCLLISARTLAQTDSSKLPLWIQTKINSHEPLQNIEKYEVNGHTVYLIQTVCCDRGFRELYNEKGALICKMKESFAGLDESKCFGFREGKWVSSVYKAPLTREQAKLQSEDEKLGEIAKKVILTSESYGAIKYGAKLSAVEKTLGQKAWHHPYEGYNDKCRLVSFPKYEAVYVKVENGIITGVVSSRFDWVTTSLKITSGMKLTEIQKDFPNLNIATDKTDRKVQYLVFDSMDAKSAMIFTVRNGTVSDVRAGIHPSVDNPRSCPSP